MRHGIFSLEMSKEQVVQRLLSSEAEVDSNRIRTGWLRESDWPKLTNAAGHLSEAPIFIDDSAALSVIELRAKARRLKAEQNIGMVVIDYLQLISGRSRSENRQQEVSDICRSLKAMAKELKVPVVALSQLARRTEERERPQLSDLRESGAIEQDSDVVMFLYRPGYYQARKAGGPDPERDTKTEIIIAKQRNGPTGGVARTMTSVLRDSSASCRMPSPLMSSTRTSPTLPQEATQLGRIATLEPMTFWKISHFANTA